ncbi:MAG: 16S rRNA (cytidine(1402)-2'-O)-methyltransferase [Bacilli bacterium]|nr:16S rRNA (cytidine(1402)-2'-O)-methyltransferase [Bacilli bacterium]
MGKLYLIPTPIGNMDDMTLRALDVLRSVDHIYCEDTRNTKKLLSHYDIHKILKSYHMFNEDKKYQEIIKELKEGMDIAVVTDAGYPGISDPGYLVCKKAIEEGCAVTTLPGPTASLTALVTSGIPCDKFYFYGFLNHEVNPKRKELESLVDFENTLIFYEAPHRINETLELMSEILGNRYICIARELTKKHEEYIRGYIDDIIKEGYELKGEMVIIVEGAKIDTLTSNLNSLTIGEHYEYYLKQNIDSKEAMKRVAKDRGVSKSDIYKEIIVKK